jgi:Helix-hairpin-helix motif
MKLLVKPLSVIVAFFVSLTMYGQDSSSTGDSDFIQQQLENITAVSENEQSDYLNLLDKVTFYHEHPINLNKTNTEELQQLHLLNDVQINNLLVYIENNGDLLSIYELQSIPLFDLNTIKKILPFVLISSSALENTSAKKLLTAGKHTIILRYAQALETQKGFTPIDSVSLSKSINSRYIGSPERLYARYNFSVSNQVSCGITAEKDQGELLFKNQQRFKYDWYNNALNGNLNNGFDFYSAHLFVQNMRFVKALTVGDYHVSFGQGLTAWSGFAFGKSTDITSIKRIASGITPYKSTDENRFMRGAATTFQHKYWELSLFASRHKIDANITDTLNGATTAVSSLQTTGYHSTPNEIADKDAITQTITGGNIAYNRSNLHLGVTAIDYQLNATLNRDLNTTNQFEFSQRHNVNVGIDYNYTKGNFNIVGEQAMSQNGGFAFANGLLVYLHKQVSFVAMHRLYQRNYQNLLSNGISENSKLANEQGLYMGVNIELTPKITLATYHDRFTFPWLSYQADAPAHGNETVAQLTYTPSKKTMFYMRYRQSNSQANTTTNDEKTNHLIDKKQQNIRLQFDNTIIPSITLKNRIELVNYTTENNTVEYGYMLYQDMTYKKMGSRFSTSLRYSVFDTDSYTSRIYTYENDMTGAFSVPGYYGKGSRFYILVNYQLNRHISCWLRYAQTFYDNTHVISQGGLTEIQGDTKSEIKAQIVFSF